MSPGGAEAHIASTPPGGRKPPKRRKSVCCVLALCRWTYSLIELPMTPATKCFWKNRKIKRIGKVAQPAANIITPYCFSHLAPFSTDSASCQVCILVEFKVMRGHKKLFHLTALPPTVHQELRRDFDASRKFQKRWRVEAK